MPPKAPPQPVQLRLQRFPDREATLEAHGAYEGLQFTVWANLPDAERLVCKSDGELILKVLRSWNLKLEDGSAAPITDETLGQLPGDLFVWLVTAWQAEARNPLAVTRSAPTPNGTPNGAK